jgi:hypothetical protein
VNHQQQRQRCNDNTRSLDGRFGSSDHNNYVQGRSISSRKHQQSIVVATCSTTTATTTETDLSKIPLYLQPLSKSPASNMIMRQQLSLGCLAVLPLATWSFPGVAVTSSRREITSSRTTTTTALYGLFDGVKDAFSAPTLERSQIDAERETPIDRWMGWSVASENKNKGMQQQSKIGTYCLLWTLLL